MRKFELPYKALLDRGVKFHAALGNHDSPRQAAYKLFNMGGKRYYTFRPRSGIRFFALDSTLMDKAQLEWLREGTGRFRKRMEDRVTFITRCIRRARGTVPKWVCVRLWNRCW